jgi:hypothetical protein
MLRDHAEKIALEHGDKRVATEILRMLNPEEDDVHNSSKVA